MEQTMRFLIPIILSLLSSSLVAAPTNKQHPDITEADLQKHIYYLASEELAGRGTGTEGERLAREYISNLFSHVGLSPAGKNGSYLEPFEFTAGATLGANNNLFVGPARTPRDVNEDWRPLVFSKTGQFAANEIVFAGYGMKAPAADGIDEYDSFVHLDVENKWVLVFRYYPENVSSDMRRHLNRYSALRLKAKIARDLGAKGLIVVTGPNSDAQTELVPISFDAAAGSTTMFGISITNSVAESLLLNSGKTLKVLQDTLDQGDMVSGFVIEGASISGSVDINVVRKTGHNIVGRLVIGETETENAIMIGAHYDHLGTIGEIKTEAEEGIHYGADDNASGTAGMMEIAEKLAHMVRTGNHSLKKDVIFAAWSGEELGLLGSAHYAKSRQDENKSLYSKIGAYFNMDMIGRLEKDVVLQGVGSSKVWTDLINQYNTNIGLPVTLSDDPYLPTDSTSFYLKKVPTLNAFTGAHEDYHTPRDTADKIDYVNTAKVTRLMSKILIHVAGLEESPAYEKVPQPGTGGGFRVYMGTIPDYSRGDVKGVLLSGVKPDSPAEAAGLAADDIIVELDGVLIENIYDYSYALSGLKPNVEVGIVVERNDERLSLKITPVPKS
jgi:hypothetical protein